MRLVLLLFVGACYAPTPIEGAPCSADESCPASQMCAFGSCVTEPPACIPIDNGPGKLVAPRLDRTNGGVPIVDGKLDDWPTCFISVDPTSAGLVRDLGAGGRFTSGRFAVAAGADRVYLVAEMQIVAPLGDHAPPAVYLNNAISTYFDGDGSFVEARYGSDAAQIVVDHANRSQAFRSGTTVTVPGVQSAATTSGTLFTIEMSVTPATFGMTAFGSQIGFDIGLVGGNGTTMTSELVWFQACKAPVCGCTSGDAAPYCDAREFGTLTIEP